MADAKPVPAASNDGFGLIVRDHRFWRIAFVNFSSLGVVLAVQGLWGAPYLSVVYGLGDLQVGNALVVMGIGVIIGNLACGWLSDRFGRGVVVLTSASVFLASQALLALAPSGLPIGLTYLAFGLFSSYFVALVDEVRTVFPPHLTGRAMTGLNFFGMTGAMFFQWLMGVIIEASSGGADATVGYRLAFLMTTAMGGLALLLYVPVARGGRA